MILRRLWLKKALILLSDDEKALTFGKNGKQAVETKYNWEHDSARLVELYDQLL